ncbi:2-hydroxyacid dehydrogenase [Solicola sp. PLA-1-18]|uniref:2-hydroxyacid dehydrogenase n=1 Tax=Solicola sp. PLA-1-18 TaxID=3380532 RepID=UPI003B7977B2
MTLVWTPYDADFLGDLPDGVEHATFVDGEPPERIDEVELWVPSYSVGPPYAEIFAQMTSLKVVQTQSAGTDAVEPHLPGGVTLCNARGVHDAATAEMAVTLVLSSLRDVPRWVRGQDSGSWEQDNDGPALADKRVMILGYGSIGEAVERRLAGFEVEVVRVARRERDGVHPMGDLPSLLPEVDVVVLLVPLSDATRHLVDADFLARLKDGALLVNVARGPVVDTDALLAELRSGRLHAALDVTDPEPLPADHPLWSAPGVLVTPHVAGGTQAMAPRIQALLRDQLARFAAGRDLRNVVVPATT